jgi:tetratricopeptide (TPR) repeat protein
MIERGEKDRATIANQGEMFGALDPRLKELYEALDSDLRKNLAESYFWMAVHYKMTGNKDLAKASLEKMLQYRPDMKPQADRLASELQ